MEQRSFTKFMELVIEELRSEDCFATAHIYGYALKASTDFVGGGEVFFGALSRRSLKRFQEHLHRRQRSYNTVSTYVRALRAVYNRAVDRELVMGDYRLFAGLQTGVYTTRKLALTADQMGRLLSPAKRAGLPATVQKAQDTLALMLLLQGMPYVDLAHLHKSDLKNDLLVCRRRKTDTELNVPVVPEAMALIDRYRNTDDGSPYLLNLLDPSLKGEDAFNEYQDKLRVLNFGLEKLPILCGVEGVRVTSYTGRHTWATAAKFCQIPEEIISEGLGHSSLEVTRTYLKSFEGGVLKKANRMIIDYIYFGRKEAWAGA